MESRHYNHPSLGRLRHARFHMFIIVFSAVICLPVGRQGIPVWRQAGRNYNHPSV